MTWDAMIILAACFAAGAAALIIAMLVTLALDLIDRRAETDQ